MKNFYSSCSSKTFSHNNLFSQLLNAKATRTVILAAFMLVMCVSSSHAVTYYWKGITTSGGSWTTPSLWSTQSSVGTASSIIPPTGSSLVFASTGTTSYTVTNAPGGTGNEWTGVSTTAGGTGTITITQSGANGPFYAGALTVGVSLTLNYSTTSVILGTSSTTASTVASGKTLTMGSSTTLDVGYSETGTTVLTITGTCITAVACGWLTGANTNIVVASGGLLQYPGTGSSYPLYGATANSGGTISFTGSGGWDYDGELSISGTLALHGQCSFINSGAVAYSGSSSVLAYYDSSGSITQGFEWSNSNGSESPHQVILNCGTSTVTLSYAQSMASGTTLTLTSGYLGLSNYNLTLATSSIQSLAGTVAYGIITGGSGNYIVDGVSSAYTFPVASSSSNYAPIIVTPVSSTNVTVSVAPLSTSVISSANAVNEQWTVLTSGGVSCTIKPEWITADQGSSFGTPTTADMANYTSSWQALYPSLNKSGSGTVAAPYYVSQAGITVPSSAPNLYIIGDQGDVTAQLALNISGNTGYCSGVYPTLTANCTANCSGITYLWSPGGATTSSLTVTATGTYSVTGSASGEVSATASTVVSNYGSPLAGGTYSVGTGYTYPTLTGAGGLFAAINAAGGISGNITANVYTSTVETGANTLNALSYNGCTGAGPYTIYINPAPTISSMLMASTSTLTSTPMIGIAGIAGSSSVPSLVMDGRAGGSGAGPSYWTFTNTNPSSSAGTIVLSGATTYAIFSYLSINNSGTNQNSYAVDLQGTTSHCTFNNCTLTRPTASFANSSYCVLNSNPSAVQTNNSITYCTIQNGATGIYLYGYGSTPSTGNYIANNTFTGQYYEAMELDYQNGATIDSNNITVTSAYSGFYTIYLTSEGTSSGNVGFTLQGNTINMNNSSGSMTYGIYLADNYAAAHTITGNSIYYTAGNIQYGIYNNYYGGTSGSPTLIANNMIEVNPGTSTQYGGIYLASSSGSYENIYFNSINVASTTANATPNGDLWIAAGISPSASIKVKNNIFENQVPSSQAVGIYMGNNSSTPLSGGISNNDYYTAGGNVAGINGTYYTFSCAPTWATTIGETNGVNANPLFTSNSNLHMTYQTALYGKAATGTGVTVDFDGQNRCPGGSCPGGGTIPDIGADEWGPTVITPVAAFTASTVTPCIAQTITFTDNSTNYPNQWAWVFTPSTVTYLNCTSASSQNPQVEFNTAGTYTVQLTATNSAGSNVLTQSNYVTVKTYMAGNYTIGSSGNYTTFKAAIADLACRGISAAVDFKASAATYSEQDTIPAISGTSSTNTITFESLSGANNDVIFTTASASSTATLLLNGASYITFKNMTIANSTNGGGSAVELLNGANNNTLNNLVLNSANQIATSGTVFLYANTANNTGNIIENCNIAPSGSNYPYNGICAYATSPYYNSSIQVLNNQIHDFASSGSATANGILVTGSGTADNGDTWTIRGNSLYRSVANIESDYLITGINFVPSTSSGTSSNDTIANNTIGGSYPVTGGQAPAGTWISTANGSNQESFTGILIEAQGAYVANNYIGSFFDLTGGSSSTYSGFNGIDVLQGFSGGTITITADTIGSTKGPGNLYYTTTSGNVTMVTTGNNLNLTVGTGLSYAVGDTVIVFSNSIVVSYTYYMRGKVTAYNSGTGAMTVAVSSYLGSGSGVMSVVPASGATTNGQFYSVGIWAGFWGATTGSVAGTCNVTNNIVGNIYDSGSNNGEMGGIVTTRGGTYTITGNTVYNLSTNGVCVACAPSYLSTYSSIVGIAQQNNASVVNTVSNNTIYNLYYTGTGTTDITGIELTGPLSASYIQIADANLVYGLSVPNTNTTSTLYGINLTPANSNMTPFKITNSMIDLGLRTDGTTITSSTAIYGIADNQGGYTYGHEALYHNSVYIGGTGVSGSVNTFGFYRNNSSSTRDTIDMRNNIFVNNRSSSGGGNYSIGYEATTDLSSANSYENYNVYFGNGTGYSIAQIGGTAYTSFSAIRTATSNTAFDTKSINDDPQYISPTAATPSLDISSTLRTPVEAAGTSAATVTYDFHGKLRASYTPVDIGADAGNFLAPPVIVYTPFTATGSTSNITLSNVRITSASSTIDTIDVTGVGLPRLYYKISTESNAINGNTSATAGWKYVEATGTTNSMSFTIDYSKLDATPVVGTTIQYFVIAQDNNSPNIVGINSGTFPGSPNYPSSVSLATANLPTGTINSYTITNSISSTYYVGSAGTGSCSSPTYTTLTGSGGFFAAMNSGNFTLDKNVTVYITSSITEPGTNALNLIPQGPNGPFVMTITPCSATAMTLSGGSTTSIIALNGAAYVTIDGQYAGDGVKHLTIQNTSTDAAASGNYSTIWFENDAVHDTVRNCLIQGHEHNNNGGVVFFGASIGTLGNSYDGIVNDSIGPINIGTANVDKASNLICSYGTAAAPNGYNTIGNCNLTDFSDSTSSGTQASAIYISGTGSGSQWKIKNNSIYRSTAKTDTKAMLPLYFVPGAASINDSIIGNYIGGNAPLCGGTSAAAWTSSYAGGLAGSSIITLVELAVGTNDAAPCFFGGNTINNFLTVESTTGVSLIALTVASGSVDIKAYNQVGNAIGSTSDVGLEGSGATSENFYGIYTASANTVIIDSTNMYNIELSTASSANGSMYGIVQAGTGNIITTNNVIAFLFNASSNSSAVIAGIYIPQVTTTGNRVENNSIVGLGTESSTANSSAVYGILITGTGAASTVKSNYITELGHYGTGGTIVGLYLNDVTYNTGTYQVWNNMIYLNNNVGSPPTSTAYNTIYGIMDNGAVGSTSNYYYNTVMIDSLQSTGSGYPSAAFIRAPNKSTAQGGTVTLEDNIFINRRSGGSSTSSIHYAVINQSATNTGTGWTSNYNFIGSTNTGAVSGGNCIGLWNTTKETTWSGWQGVSGDGFSKNAQVLTATTHTVSSTTTLNTNLLFQNDSNNSASSYILDISLSNAASYAFVSGLATPISGITTDINGNTRCPASNCPGNKSAPDIGADEFGTGNDAGVTAITIPCPGSSQPVYATITNYGSITLTSVTVNWKVNGTAQSAANLTGLSLTTGQSAVKQIGTYTFTSGTSYTFDDSTSSPNGVQDGNTSNDDYTVSGYVGFPGTVYIGTGGGSPSYATYSAFFTAINSSSLASNVTAYVQNSTVEPLPSVYLNALTACGTDTIFIKPASATVFTDSTSDIFSATIGFNGASNVVIDGSYGGSGKYLRFINYNTSNSYGTILFQNSSNNITVKNCIVDLQCSAASTAPVISLSTSTSGSTGNSYLTISNDSIGDNGSAITYYSTNIIQSSGTAGTPNHDNTIANNSIFNFSDATQAYAINVTATGNGSNWKINGNSIFNTHNITTGQQTAIQFAPGSSSSSDSISNNYIGGSTAYCGNSGLGYWENSYAPSSCGLNTLTGINLNAGTVAVSGNLFERILLADLNYSGITVVNIAGSTNATITGNTMGNADGVQADEIVCEGGGYSACVTPGYVQGIYSTSTGAVTISNNNFIYLQMAGAIYGGQVFGVYDLGTGNINVTNNIFFALQSNGQNGNSNAIEIYPNSGAGSISTLHVDSNTIIGPFINGVNNSYSQTAVTINAIYVNGTSMNGTVNKNTISDMWNQYGYKNSSQFGLVRGIYVLGTGTYTVSNNSISIQDSTFQSAIYGIEEDLTGGSSAFNGYYNSVYIGGIPSATNGGLSSYCFVRVPGGTGTVAGDVITLKNNIFVNNRTSDGSTGNFAIGNFGSSNYATNWNSGASDYNLLATSSSANLADWGNNVSESFTGWKNASSGDTHSDSAVTTSSSSATLLYPGDLFTTPTGELDINLSPTYSPWPYLLVQTGAYISTVLTDIHGTTRSTSTPKMGVDEFVSCSTPTVTVTNTSNSCGSAVLTASPTGAGATYLWSPGSATTSSITVTNSSTYSVTVTVAGGCSATSSGSGSPYSSPSANASSTPASCNGYSNGSVLSSPTGGAGGYTYLWSPGGSTSSSVTGLGHTGTTYTVTVTDANTCTATGTATVTQPTAIVAGASATPAACYGYTNGSVSSSPSGGSGSGYTYSWSTGSATTSSVSSLGAGTYTVTVTDGTGCTGTGTATVTQPSPVTAPTVTDVDNCGNSVLSTTSAGTLHWNTGATTSSITVTTGGTYSVTKTDGTGCTSIAGTGTANPTSVPSAPVVNVVNNCNGTSSLYTSASGSLLWSSGGATTSSIIVSSAGTYSVTTTVSSCASSPGTGVAAPNTTPSAPVVTAVNNCDGTSTLSTTATGTLAWSTTATTSSITTSTAGTYSVTTTVNTCTSAAGTASAILGSCSATFTVKSYIQGYYIGSGKMSPLMKLLNISGNATDVDTVTIQLRSASSTGTVAYSYTGILQSNGNLVCTFSGGSAGNAYYIVINHRNSLQTWSASPVTITNGGSYDFTTGAGQAYSSNMVNLGSGVYGIYSGDINQDGSINSTDKASLQTALPSLLIGVYNVNDVTGDGFVDEDDFRILENNVPLSISVQHP